MMRKKSLEAAATVACAARQMVESGSLGNDRSVDYLVERCLVGVHTPMSQALEGSRRHLQNGSEQYCLPRTRRMVIVVGAVANVVNRWEFVVRCRMPVHCLGKEVELVQNCRAGFEQLEKVSDPLYAIRRRN